jgi:hypothetical protein
MPDSVEAAAAAAIDLRRGRLSRLAPLLPSSDSSLNANKPHQVFNKLLGPVEH